MKVEHHYMQWLRSKPCYISGRSVGVEVAHLMIIKVQGSNFTPISERTFDYSRRSHKGSAAFHAIPLHVDLHRIAKDCIHSGREIEFFESYGLTMDKVYSAIIDYISEYAIEELNLQLTVNLN